MKLRDISDEDIKPGFVLSDMNNVASVVRRCALQPEHTIPAPALQRCASCWRRHAAASAQALPFLIVTVGCCVLCPAAVCPAALAGSRRR